MPAPFLLIYRRLQRKLQSLGLTRHAYMRHVISLQIHQLMALTSLRHFCVTFKTREIKSGISRSLSTVCMRTSGSSGFTCTVGLHNDFMSNIPTRDLHTSKDCMFNNSICYCLAVSRVFKPNKHPSKCFESNSTNEQESIVRVSSITMTLMNI